MSLKSALEYLSLWQLFGLTVVISLASFEVGFRGGARRRQVFRHEQDSTLSASIGATLALLGFMIAMTFGVAIAQFDSRREALVAEVNAISTAYLRAELLPLDLRGETRTMLREYVKVRLLAADTGTVKEAGVRSQDLHRQLWSTVVLAHDEVENPILFGLYAQAIGDLLDAHTRRIVAAFQSRIPAVIWFVLFLIAIIGVGEIGYQAGLSGSSRSPTHLGLVLALAAVLWLVADLDRPREGAIRVSQRSMRDLERFMQDDTTRDQEMQDRP